MVKTQTRVECLVDDRMGGSSEEMRQLNGRGALIDYETTHAPRARARVSDGDGVSVYEGKRQEALVSDSMAD